MDLSQLIPENVNWWDIILVLAVIIVGWITSRLTRKGALALLRKTPGVTETVAVIASRVAGYAILLLAFGIALALLGANIQPLLAIVIIVGVVVALVLRGVADNFAAGVLIQARQTVKIGDELQLEGPDGLVTGTVIELNSRSVLLVTVDGRTVHIPNSRLLSEPIVNDSSTGARRSEVQVRVARDGRPVGELIDLLVDAATSAPGVTSAQPVRALPTAVSTERLTAQLQFWHEPLEGVVVTAAVVLATVAAFEAAGLEGAVTSQLVVPPLVPPDGV